MRIFLEKQIQALKNIYHSTDILFLIFLVLFLNVKLPVKLAGLILIYAFRFNFKFDIHLKKSRLPLFYLLMVLLSVIELFLNFNFAPNYLLLFTTCTCLWSISFLVIHQIKLAIEKNGVEKVKKSLEIFLILNILVSFWNILMIMLETKSINPYTFEGLSYKYYVSTGDYIRGLTGDVCTTNMIISAFGVFYFLQQKRYCISLASLAVVLLTTSNLGNIILLVFLAIVFITDPNKLHKSIALCYVAVLAVFMIKVSPSNLDYFQGTYHKINENKTGLPGIAAKHVLNTDSLLLLYVSKKNTETNQRNNSPEVANKELAINEIQKKVNSHQDQIRLTDSNFDDQEKNIHHKIITYCRNLYGDSLHARDVPFMKKGKTPGKIVSFIETVNYMSSSVKIFLFGSGPGNFSSKMAFRALGLNIDGYWPAGLTYSSTAFKDNHLKLWLFYKIQNPSEHSVINHPNSVSNQLLGEYGLVGVLLFLFYYAWYFLKRYKILSYGRIILPLFLIFLLTDYWFENLSIIIIFETMILLDLNHKTAEE